MQLEWIMEWADSGGTNCPAFYQLPNGDLVAQGWKIDDAARAQLRKLADNEDAVVLPASLVTAMAEHLKVA